MSPELFRDIKDIVKLVVVTVLMWLAAHGYIKDDIEQAKVEAMAQTDEQTETMKAEAKKTRQKVVEETNEVIEVAETTAAELVQAAPAMQSAQPQTDPAIAEMLLNISERLDKIEKERGTP